MSENKEKKEVTFIPINSDSELFLKYSTQTQPQDASLCLNLETGELSADVDANIGGSISGRAWHNLDIEWTIPPLKMKPLQDLMRKVKEHCQTILDDSRVEWDSSNWKGYLGVDADHARDQIQYIIDHSNFDVSQIWGSWDACDWFSECIQYFEDEIIIGNEHKITRKTKDKEIEDLAEKLEQEARDEHDITLEDTEDYLRSLRDVLRDDFYVNSNCNHENYTDYRCNTCDYDFCYECAPNNLSEGPSPERIFVDCPVCGADCSEFYGGIK